MKKKLGLLIFTLLLICFFAYAIPSAFSQPATIDDEITELNNQIQQQKKQMEEISSRQKEYQQAISAKKRDQASLKNQLSILEDREAQTQLDIEKTNLNIDKTSLEIKKLELDMLGVDREIENDKDKIGNLLRLVYKQDQISSLEALLLNGSLAEFLNQAKYLENTNEKIRESLQELQRKKSDLDQSQISLGEKNKELLALKKELEKKKESLAYEQESKVIILEETKSSEEEYQRLLAQAKREQQQAEAEISSLEKSVRRKMSEKEKNQLEGGSTDIAWPTSGRYITTGFHDQEYPYRKIIGEHPAIDIRAPQGTTLRAAGDGYVARVKYDGTNAYAYIMIIHSNGLSTVYGHVSAVSVEQDQYVLQGDKIGLTGGAPRSIGAGAFTTGPHLHFEVRKNGIPVNPLDYLP
ncbi:MAG: peptidoglycan DD-metalloendopeptidase family protein [Candidatus Parcubacteria bacterium]